MKTYRRLSWGFVPPALFGFLLAVAACDSGPEPDTEIPFRELEGYLVTPVFTPDAYVFRTKEAWEAVLSPVLPPGLTDPPPPVSFADSVVLGVSYGDIWCTHHGGNFARTVQEDNRITVSFKPLISKDTVCLASLPLQVFAQVPRSAFTEDVEVTFEVPEIPNP